MSALGEFLDGVFARLRLRSLRMFWHVGFWGLALAISIASGFAPCCLGWVLHGYKPGPMARLM